MGLRRLESAYSSDPKKQQRWGVYVTSMQRIAGLRTAAGGSVTAVMAMQKDARMTEWDACKEIEEFQQKFVSDHSSPKQIIEQEVKQLSGPVA